MTPQSRILGGRYEIGGMIGYGGMAEVHRGRDIRLGRDVAIKMLRTDLARDETFLTRFRREAHNAATLNHPSIVAVYDTGEDGESTVPIPYIVMEYVEGRTLKEVLVAEGRLSPRRACEVLADVCAALDFSHRHQIIHRDVKPGNVMLSTNGQVKVMDFGIARALAAGQATMTQTSAVIGTAQYLSPEQARGETVDARSDVYATGCLLYEMLCGEPPFTGDNPVSVAYQHVREAPIPPSQRNPDIPPAVDAITLKALEKNAVNRYQSAGEMRDDLERAIAGRPVLATPVMTAEERTQLINAQNADETRVSPVVSDRARKKHTGRKVAVAMLALLLIAGLGFGAWYMTQGAGSKVAVPEVEGFTQERATKALKNVDFEVDIEPVASSDQQQGKVMKQLPGPKTKVKKGSTVVLHIGQGRDEVKVPDLSSNRGCDEMERELKELDLKAECEPVSSDKQAGDFISQDPEKGKKIKTGETVTVEVSKDDETSVPDVMGLSEEKACDRIEEEDLKCEVATELKAGDSDDAGKVVESSPGNGEMAKKGSVVTIHIGGVKVPDLVAGTVAEAQEAIEELGLKFDAGGATDEQKVTTQTPESGEVVEKDTTVTVEADVGFP